MPKLCAKQPGMGPVLPVPLGQLQMIWGVPGVCAHCALQSRNEDTPESEMLAGGEGKPPSLLLG